MDPMLRALCALAIFASVGCRRTDASPPPDPARADASAQALSDERACVDRNDGAACRRAALASIDRHDDESAVRLADLACGHGHLPGCKTLGWLYENGRGVGRDFARARALYGRACDGGDLSACKSLGLLYDTGQGGAIDRRRAAALYQRACDAGELDACNNLANLYVGGDGVTRDLARAAALYDRVCAASHNTRACGNADAMRALADGGVDGGASREAR